MRSCMDNLVEAQSCLEMLHEVLHESNLFTQHERTNANEMVVAIASWRGIAQYHPFEYARQELQLEKFEEEIAMYAAQMKNESLPEEKRAMCKVGHDFHQFALQKQQEAVAEHAEWKSRVEARRNAAATEYLRIVRALESLSRKYRGGPIHCRKIASLLGMGKLPPSPHLSQMPATASSAEQLTLLQVSVDHTISSLALFLVWPREPSLYVRSDPSNEKRIVAHEILPPLGDDYKIQFGKLSRPVQAKLRSLLQCSSCDSVDVLLMEVCQTPQALHSRLCCDCALIAQFGATSKIEVKAVEPAVVKWPYPGACLPLAEWIEAGCPWRFVLYHYSDQIEDHLRKRWGNTGVQYTKVMHAHCTYSLLLSQCAHTRTSLLILSPK